MKISQERPAGLIDGINQKFTLRKFPLRNSESIFVNGMFMERNVDYTISGKNVKFNYFPDDYTGKIHGYMRKGYKILVNYETKQNF